MRQRMNFLLGDILKSRYASASNSASEKCQEIFEYFLACFSSLRNTFPSNGFIFQALPQNGPTISLMSSIFHHHYPYFLDIRLEAIFLQTIWTPRTQTSLMTCKLHIFRSNPLKSLKTSLPSEDKLSEFDSKKNIDFFLDLLLPIVLAISEQTDSLQSEVYPVRGSLLKIKKIHIRYLFPHEIRIFQMQYRKLLKYVLVYFKLFC